MSKLKLRNNLMSKFRKDLSPQNYESTKDASSENKNEFKVMEKRLKEYLN